MVIKISEQTITVEGAGKLVSNSVGQYALDYEFTDEYAPYDKFAVFAREDGSTDPVEVALTGMTGSVVIPWEVLRESGALKIGAYGINGDLVRPTVWSKKLSIIEGAAPGDTAHQPTILPWEEIVMRIGDLNDLETQDKSNLVAAINEVAQGGGGGGTSDHAQLENRDAVNQHPIKAISGLEEALSAKGTYNLPTGGIPASDMTAAVQESIGLANSALQSESDPTVPAWAKAAQKPTYTAQEIGAATPSDVQTAAGELQEQIDALVSKSDVVDVVANYAALQAYDTSTLLNNNVVKVLSDSTHSDGRSYYRWTVTGDTGAWTYIGTESIGYTKAETDNLLNAKQPTISDLVTIRSGAAAGATAVQPSALNSYATQDYVNQQIGNAIGGEY